ncbi:hypothetical protein TWF751_002900 [Orbilia oligospora]|nr:hypothetical protein TWF751_002900 [Orbilia oligospora]
MHFRTLTMKNLYKECHIRFHQDPAYRNEGKFGHAATFHRFGDDPITGLKTARHKNQLFKEYGQYVKDLTISHATNAHIGGHLINAYNLNYSVLATVYLPTISTPLLESFTTLINLKFSTSAVQPSTLKSHEIFSVIEVIFKSCHSLKDLSLDLDIGGFAPYKLKRMVQTPEDIDIQTNATLPSLRNFDLKFLISTKDRDNRYTEKTGVWILTWEFVANAKRLFRKLVALVLYTSQTEREINEAIGEDFRKIHIKALEYWKRSQRLPDEAEFRLVVNFH